MNGLNVITVLSVILLIIYAYLKRRHNYWKRKGLGFIEPYFFYGNVKRLAKGEVAFGEQFKELYLGLKARGFKTHAGIYVFFNPIYVPLDPALIKCIMQKDFESFRNHGLYVNEESDPLSGHLFNLEDDRWRRIRVKLTPTFTSGKMKLMFPILTGCGKGVEDILNDHTKLEDPVDMKEVLSRFTTDVIGSCAFGLDCNSLKNPHTEFRKYGRKVFDGSLVSRIKLLITMFVPRQILKQIAFKFIDRDVESFFINLIRDTVNYREQNKITRKDFIHLLLQLKESGELGDRIKEGSSNEQRDLTLNELAAQSFGFFVAGFETSATTMTFALYEMASNQEVQERLREEILLVLKNYDNQLTYEAVMEMTYLDKIVHETLRKYPPAPATPRICNTSFNVPGTDFVIDAGTRVQIPIMGLHHNPEYYPNPEIFDPERFNEENKAKRPAFTYLPFGEGPRICIGARFGLLQSKVGLITIIKRFKVALSERTRTPIKLDNQSFVLGVKDGIWLNVSNVSTHNKITTDKQDIN